MMIRLNNDYSEGCHPSILLRLNEMNLEQNPGYGTDTHCAEAADAVRKAFACPDADVHFLVGGTQANMTVIAAALRPYEAVLCADTGHINVHETGAVEGTGHKRIALQSRDGRISASQISVAAAMLDDNEHVAKPAMVYISMSTELGTVYNRAQLRDIYLTCQKLGLYLFIDGARLGIFGHSMGGHGALTLALRHPGRFKSLSAFAPICAPTRCPWGVKAFTGYLGPDRAGWGAHDATGLMEQQSTAPYPAGILIDQGLADKFLAEQLHPKLFNAACALVGQPLTLRRHEGYDHGYYFIQTFVQDHLRHHAQQLAG